MPPSDLPPSTPVAVLRAAAVEGGSAHRVRDYATGEGWRHAVAAFPESAAACGWHERLDAYWALRLFSARRGWSTGLTAKQEQTVHRSRAVLAQARLLEHAAAAPPTSAVPRSEADEHADGIASDAKLVRAVSILRNAISCSDGQMAALLGDTEPECTVVARPLVAHGVAGAALHHAPGLPYPRIRLWRIRRGPAWHALVREILRRGDGPAVFGSAQPSGADDLGRGRDSRHMALAVELCLRAMECAPETWPAWLPEAQCRPRAFLPAGHPLSGDQTKAVADGCLVRADGLRLFVEVEASTPTEARAAEKVGHWSRLLAAGPFGAAVLFAAAAAPSQMNACSQALRRAVEAHADPSCHPRMLVGSWHDWSPDFGIVSTDAATLRCAVRRGGGWQEEHAAGIGIAGGDDGLVQRLSQCAWRPAWTGAPA